MRIAGWARRNLKPPHGIHVRRLLVLITASIALPRVTRTLQFGTSLDWLRPEIYGWLFLALAVALAVTCCRWRGTVLARIIAGVGAVLYAIAAADGATGSTTSLLVNLSLAYACLGEAATVDEYSDG